MIQGLHDIRCYGQSVIMNCQNQPGIMFFYGNMNLPFAMELGKTVFYGIFHDGLDNQLGYLILKGVRIGIDGVGKQVIGADLLNGHITLDMFQFVRYGYCFVAFAEADAKVAGQITDQSYGFIIAIHPGEHMDVIKGVVEKMWVDLVQEEIVLVCTQLSLIIFYGL